MSSQIAPGAGGDQEGDAPGAEPGPGPTLVEHFLRQVRERPGVPALYFQSGGRYAPITWGDFGVAARRWAGYLISEGVAAHDHVAIWSGNRPEWHIADAGVLCIRSRPVPVYLTLSADQAGYVLEHSGSLVAVVENGVLRDRVLEVRDRLPSLRRIVVLEGQDAESADGFVIPWQAALHRGEGSLTSTGAELDGRAESVSADDVATLIYTSGTTGPPKAVLLTHANVAAAVYAMEEFIPTGPLDRVVSHLPLAHIAERLSSEFRSYVYGHPVYFVDSIPNLGRRLREVRPTLFFTVPRVWEKMAQQVRSGIDALPAPRRWLARWALKAGAQRKLADRLVLRKLREMLGLDQARVLASGAAPIAADVLRFFSSLGLEVLEVYGQTEDTGLTTMNRPGRSRIGTVGGLVRGNEVHIAQDGEILVRGEVVFTGYYKDPAATAEALEGGWLHTGDVGEFDADGYLRITDRKKDLIITAGGKNISPSNIEGELAHLALIGHAVVIGDRRPFISALLTLDPETSGEWAKARGITGGAETLAGNQALHDEIAAHVAAVNTRLSQVEQVKKWTLLPHDFEVGDELTPTLKVKRKVVAEKYESQIEELYVKH